MFISHIRSRIYLNTIDKCRQDGIIKNTLFCNVFSVVLSYKRWKVNKELKTLCNTTLNIINVILMSDLTFFSNVVIYWNRYWQRHGKETVKMLHA